MRSNPKKLWRLAFCVWALVFVPPGRAQSGITNVDSYTVFRTGTNEPLLTLSLTNGFHDFGVIPTLSFEFGFATEETNAPDTFFDSFFLTLQTSNASATVFSADQTGVAWAPRTPGGVELNTNEIHFSPVTFPTNVSSDLSSTFSLQLAYSVSLFLPGPLSASELSIFFDFFDNLNRLASIAYLIGLRLDATGSVGTQARFYRLNSTIATHIDSIEGDGSSVLLSYHFKPSILELYSALTTNGPFILVTNAALRATEQVFVLNSADTNRVFHVRADTNATVISVSNAGAVLFVEFDFDTNVAPVQVESALSANAAFFEHPNTRAESTRRKLRVAQPGFVLPP